MSGATEAGGGIEAGRGVEQTAQAIRVVAGAPTAEELAAVVTVLTALAAAGGARQSGGRTPSRWSAHERGVRVAPHPSPGGWRASAFPLH